MKRSFDDWMAAVNERIAARVGLSSDDLPDICYRDMYDDGMSPASAAAEALQNAQE